MVQRCPIDWAARDVVANLRADEYVMSRPVQEKTNLGPITADLERAPILRWSRVAQISLRLI
jgi:hypothetical protein